jgi:hypothetical protein
MTIPVWLFDWAADTVELDDLERVLRAWEEVIGTSGLNGPKVEADVKADVAAEMLGIEPAELLAMCRRGGITASTVSKAGKRWYPMSELRRVKPDVGPAPERELLSERELRGAARYRRLYPWLDEGWSA